jgi:hypothetical protein
MPTGYTNELDERDMSTEQWFLTVLTRAFGVCVTLREDGLNLPEKEVLKRLKEDSTVDYYKKSLAENKAKLKEYLARSETDWVKAWEADEAERKQGNEERTKKAKIMADRHQRVINDLKRVCESDVDETTRNIAKFGLDQLKEVADECEPFIIAPQSLERYKATYLQSVQHDLEYDKDELRKAIHRKKERIEIYKTIQKDVHSIFSVQKHDEVKKE